MNRVQVGSLVFAMQYNIRLSLQIYPNIQVMSHESALLHLFYLTLPSRPRPLLRLSTCKHAHPYQIVFLCRLKTRRVNRTLLQSVDRVTCPSVDIICECQICDDFCANL